MGHNWGEAPPSYSGYQRTNPGARTKAQVSEGTADGDSHGPPLEPAAAAPSLIFVTAEPISMVTCSGDGDVIGTSFGESLSKLNALRL